MAEPDPMPTRVLVVDDDEVDREHLTRMLMKLGHPFEIVEAASVAAAAEELERSQFDCVFLDYHLAGELGIELMPAVRAHRPEVCPVIMCTTRQDERLVVEVMRGGVTDYISKKTLELTQLKEILGRNLRWARSEMTKQVEAERASALLLAQRREYELSLRVALQQAESSSRAKSLFLANMSHEIRTPMNAVIGLTYLLERTSLDDEQTTLVNKVRLASKTLLSIINDVLDLSKIEASELRLERAPFSLSALLHDLSELFAVEIQSKGIGYQLQVPRDLPDTLLGDATRLHQVLLNLLSNAIKFTERGVVRLIVQPVAASSTQLRLRFMVQDSGIGIPPEAQERLFQPFVQADASTTRRYGGTGLGLSIVKQLVSLMGGQVGVSSVQGSGSDFHVELDFPVADLLATGNPDAPRARAGDSPALQGVRVLVVDDSSINLEVARRILELEGAKVELARHGQEAMDCLLALGKAVDVVLMDIQMPVLDGLDATHRIRSGLGLTELPIIALTAGTLVGHKEQAEAAGMNDFVSKPFDPDALVGCIRRQLLRPPSEPTRELAQSCPVPDDSWPRIPGIDTADACARLLGDVALFRSSLRRLLNEYADLQAPGGDDEQSWKQMSARLHKLKGSAGIIGAKSLARLAAEADMHCRARELNRARQGVARLARRLARLTLVAQPVLATSEPELEEAQGSAVPHKLSTLLELLQEQDLAAVPCFHSLDLDLRARLGASLHAELTERLEQLRFGEVRKILQTKLPLGSAAAEEWG